MNVLAQEAKAASSKLEVEERRELFVSANGSDPAEMQLAAEEEAARRGAKILERFVFAGTGLAPAFQKKEPRPSQGLAWLQGDACSDGKPSSLQAFALAGAEAKPVVFDGELAGWSYEDSLARYCRLSGVTPGDPSTSRKEQTKEVFEKAGAILESVGFQFSDTVRTWLYLDKLLSWYKEFNEVRTAYFEKAGVFEKLVPASTGIGAANQSGGALLLGLYAIKPKDGRLKIRTVDSPLQGSAMSYRSSFSRAVELSTPSWKSLMISGTASIDKAGASIHLGAPERQVETTADVLEALLKSRGMEWGDVKRGIAYFKSMAYLPLFEKLCAKRGIPASLFAIAHADVCRDELLFEAELEAAKNL